MRLATQKSVPVSILNTKRRLATLLLGTLVVRRRGVQEGQEEAEKARQVQKQLEKKQQELEE
jgi:hypothetical protein